MFALLGSNQRRHWRLLFATNNYKCSFSFDPTDLNPADIPTQMRQLREVLEELMITNQDLTEPLQNPAVIPRKQEEPTEGKPEYTLEKKLNR